MKTYLLDADATRCLRDLSLLRALSLLAPDRVALWMTEYIARRELSLISRDIEELEKTGKLVVQSVVRGGEVFQRARELKRSGLDPGEAEAIAWALGRPAEERPLFVSNDRRAREEALRMRVPAGDLMDLLVEIIDAGLMGEPEASDKVSIWSDKSQSLCRPRDFSTFEDLLDRRRSRGALRA